MSQTSFRPETQAIIDRLSKIDYEKPKHDKNIITKAFHDHLKALNLPIRPVKFFKDADSGYSATRGAAWGAARDAAWDAAWDAAVEETLYDHPRYAEFKATWMPFTEAMNAGLFIYWVTPKEVLAVLSPVMKIQNNQLHADGEPAIYWPKEKYYFFRGVKMPEKYGSVRSEHWESKWILNEKNAELRRVLIQGIGYGKIARDLDAKSLDTWKEYELLRIENADVEPIVMVKMICPSTGLLHSHRVPPQTKTAREAIKWVNHGIDAEEFVKQT